MMIEMRLFVSHSDKTLSHSTMTNNIRDILKQYIKKDDTVILGVSGGPDSVYLLLQAIQCTKNVVVAHVNHKTRGRESDKDAEFVASLARQHRLTCETKTIKTPPKGNAEDHFRKQRYQFFERIRSKHNARWILTAHHLNDNIETVLFNLTKGSFLDGLSGINMVDTKRHLLRPLLFTSKDEILAHLKKTHTPFRLDRTNKDIAYSRNRVRHKVVPQLKSINEGLEQTFAQNIQTIQELRDYMEQSAISWLEQNDHNGGIDHEAFVQLHPVMQKSILFQVYESLYGPGKKLNQAHLQQVLSVIHGVPSNRKKEFGRRYFLNIGKKNGKKVMMITEKS